MPSLKKLHSEFMDKPFQLLTIDIQESRKNVEAFARKNNLNFPVLLDSDGKVSEMYGVSSTPMKILVDKNGNMIGAALGYRSWDKAEVRDLITLLMDADQAG